MGNATPGWLLDETRNRKGNSSAALAYVHAIAEKQTAH